MLYWSLFAVASIASVILAVWAMRRGGKRLLVSTSAVASAFLLGLGYFDWLRQAVVETPLHTYVLLAVLPTAGAAFTVALLSGRDVKAATQVMSATLVSIALATISIFSGFYP